MTAPRILVTGASGFLGSRVLHRLAYKHDVLGTYCSKPGKGLAHVDVSRKAEVDDLFDRHAFDVCIHAAANCDVENCERHPDDAAALNAEGTGNLAEASRRANVRMVYVSTDHVFGGGNEHAIAEDAEPSPIQQYGWTKLAGERHAASVAGALVLRLPVLYGRTTAGEKENFVTRCLRLLRAGERIEADDTYVRYPVLVDEAAELLARLAVMPISGTLHYSSAIGVTKYAWAKLVTEAFGHNPERISVRPEALTAARPRNNKLISTRLASLGIAPPLPVSLGVATMRND